MNQDGLQKLAEALHLKNHRFGSGNLIASCPFAPFKHLKEDGSFGRDRKPSFGIRIDDLGESVYHCFACQSQGSLLDLVGELAELREQDYSEVEEFVWQSEGATALIEMASTDPFEKHYEKRRTLPENSNADVYPESEYEPYRGSVPRYAFERGLDIETCKAWDLGHDPEEGRLMIPIRRMGDKALVGLKGRTYRNAPAKYYPYLPFSAGKWLFGEHMLREGVDDPRVVIVEGELDVIKTWMAGFNALGLMGGFPSKQHLKKLEFLAKDIVVIPDPDPTGDDWSSYLCDRMRDVVNVYHARPPKGEDPGSMPLEAIWELVRAARIWL